MQLTRLKHALKAFCHGWQQAPRCSHSKVSYSLSQQTCPDCHQVVVMRWWVLRCADCGSKRSAHLNAVGAVVPLEHTCKHCASEQTLLQPVETIRPEEAPYAVPFKQVVNGMQPQPSSNKTGTPQVTTSSFGDTLTYQRHGYAATSFNPFAAHRVHEHSAKASSKPTASVVEGKLLRKTLLA